MARPNLFLVGAAKCGTTSMWDWLGQHPDIYMAENKEPHFFATDIRTDPPMSEQEYLALFEDADDETYRGEAFAWNLYSPRATHAIRDFSTDAKILIMLRDPVERMHSNHRQLCVGGSEPIRSFEEAVEAEIDRRQGHRLPKYLNLPFAVQYRDGSRYAEHVERYFEVHGREDVHVVLLENLKEDPQATYTEVLRFLDVDASFEPQERRRKGSRNVHSWTLLRARVWLSRSKVAQAVIPEVIRIPLVQRIQRFNSFPEKRPSINRRLERRLRQELLPDIEALEDLLGEDLSSWKPVPSVGNGRTSAQRASLTN